MTRIFKLLHKCHLFPEICESGVLVFLVFFLTFCPFLLDTPALRSHLPRLAKKQRVGGDIAGKGQQSPLEAGGKVVKPSSTKNWACSWAASCSHIVCSGHTGPGNGTIMAGASAGKHVL